MNLGVTGISGFIGVNLELFFKNGFNLFPINIREDYIIDSGIDAVIHLAGIAHDLDKSKGEEIYYQVNTDMTIRLFDKFLNSSAKCFVFISSIKAIADQSDFPITEDFVPNPTSIYGKSKLAAENYIMSQLLPKGKRVFILRPGLIYGPNNKGNLSLIANYINKGYPWPLGAFNNSRSFCSISNLFFTINELLINQKISSGIYHICDNDVFSTNDLVLVFIEQLKSKSKIIKVPKFLIRFLAELGDLFSLSFNTNNLNKLTGNFIISNVKIQKEMGKSFPINTRKGIESIIYNNV